MDWWVLIVSLALIVMTWLVYRVAVATREARR